MEREQVKRYSALGLSSIREYFSAAPNVLLMGLPHSGKTTLFSRLAFGATTAPEEAASAALPTIGFHVEKGSFAGRDCLIWDIAGNEAMWDVAITSMSNCFIRGIIFVLSMIDLQPRELALARARITELVHSHRFQTACFALVLNTHSVHDMKDPQTETLALGIANVCKAHQLQQIYPNRFAWTVSNVKYGMEDWGMQRIAEWCAFHWQNC